MNQIHNQERKQIKLALGLISIFYFCIYLPINFSGSDELSKIMLFSSIDEYSQVRALEQMLETGDRSWKKIIGDFLLHNHAYGYPFFFFSALVALPVKLLHLPRPQELQWMMLGMRQQVVVFNIITCLLLTRAWAKNGSFLSTVLTFTLLLSVPALTAHNIIWHPDALSTLFMVGAFYGLTKDDFRFRKWFYVSAVCCGMACSTKFMGPFLGLMILTYLFLAFYNKKAAIPFLIKKALFYGITTITVFLVSSPLVLFGYYENVIAYLTDQSKMNNWGWGVEMPKGIGPWYEKVINPFFFHALFAISLLVLAVCTLLKNRNVVLNVLTLTAVIPLFIYVVSVIGHKNYFYLYPVFLMLTASAANVFTLAAQASVAKRTVFYWAAVGALMIFIGVNIVKSYGFYQRKQTAIATHPAFDLYKKVKTIPELSGSDTSVNVLRSAFIYLPDTLKVRHDVPYGLITENVVMDKDPEVIMLLKADAALIRETSYQNHYIDPQLARKAARFYQMAEHDQLAGYRLQLADGYGIVLTKNANEKK